MKPWRLFWLLVPLVGLCELVLHCYFARRAPRAEDWSALRPFVERVARKGDLVVVAPEWAEPLARQALGEGFMPLVDVARADTGGYQNALEVSFSGADSGELRGFRELSQSFAGKFRLRRLANPHFEPVLYGFVDHVTALDLSVVVRDGELERPCPFTDHALPSAGGLGGHVAYPRERFACGPDPYFVGVTAIDDPRYRPRRCIFAHPARRGVLALSFRDVPLGRKIHGYGGVSYLLARDGLGPPVAIRAFVDGREIGRSVHADEQGFSPFDFGVAAPPGARGVVRFEIESASPNEREFCFAAEMR